MQLFGTKGQKFPSCPGTKGQRDKLKFFPRDGILTGCPGTGQRDNYIYFFLLEVPIFRKKSDFCGCVQKQEKDVLKQEMKF